MLAHGWPDMPVWQLVLEIRVRIAMRVKIVARCVLKSVSAEVSKLAAARWVEKGVGVVGGG